MQKKKTSILLQVLLMLAVVLTLAACAGRAKLGTV